MQLIDFQITMNELGVSLKGNEAEFCGVKFTQSGNLEWSRVSVDKAALSEEMQKSVESLFGVVVIKDCIIFNNRLGLLDFVIKLAKEKDALGLLKNGDLCSDQVMRASINCYYYDLIGRHTRTNEEWLSDNNVSYSKKEEETQQEMELDGLVLEFDALVNPFTSKKYKPLFPVAFSDDFSYNASSTCSYDKEHPCFRITENNPSSQWYISCNDASELSQTREKSLSYVFHSCDYIRNGEVSTITIRHMFTEVCETLFVSVTSKGRTYNFYVDLNSKKPIINKEGLFKEYKNSVSKKEMASIILILSEAIEFIKSKTLRNICTEVAHSPQEDRSFVPKPIKTA